MRPASCVRRADLRNHIEVTSSPQRLKPAHISDDFAALKGRASTEEPACTSFSATSEAVPFHTISAQQNAHDRSRHQIGHGAGNHGAEAEFRQFAALVGRQGADASDLNSNRTEVGEAA